MMTLLNGWHIIYRPETVDMESRITTKNKHQSVRSQIFGCKFFKNVSNGIVISRPIFEDETSILSRENRNLCSEGGGVQPPSFTYFLETMQMKVEKERKREFISSLEKYYEDYYRTLKQG